MRFFPGARPSAAAVRPRHWAIVLLAAALLAGLMVPLARADDDTDKLKHDQKKVQGRIDKVAGDLHESSRRAARVAERLSLARGELRSARNRLDRVRTQRLAARRLNVRLGRQLDRAQARYATAVAALQLASADVTIQRSETRGRVIDIGTAGDPRLEIVRSYLDSGSVEDVMMTETGNAVVVDREEGVLDDLVAAEDAVGERKQTVQRARNQVARKKQAAQQNLQRMRTLNRRAKNTRNKVARLVDRTRRARKAAVRARNADRAALTRLKQREARIKQKILMASRGQAGNYRGPTDGFLHVPAGGPVTSPFGYRVHPIYGYYGLHNGTDFGAACGSALWAGSSGTVVNTYYDQVYGNRLYLAIGRINGNVITLVYNHLSSYAVREGAKVARGQVVGRVGTTGWSTGCHLHFTVLRNGNPVDPMQFL